MKKYKIIGVALKKLEEYEKLCELDTGIHGLLSGGDSVFIREWDTNMEAARTPNQRWAEQAQKEAWNDYELIRKQVILLIKEAQKCKSYPTFYIPDYEGEYRGLKAPNKLLAKQFLQIVNNNTFRQNTILRKSEIQPYLTGVRID